jgi:prevent-host-death family protein
MALTSPVAGLLAHAEQAVPETGRVETSLFTVRLTVTMIMVMTDATLPLAEVKKRLSEMVDRVEHHHERVVVTKRGRPAAVLLSPDDLESMEETLDLLSTPGALAEIQKAQHEIDTGESVSAAELREKYLKE